ncbi:hypothetical protein K491DRAFT_773960 [Lophiostoma macrostomum CBS 122681]|uniref:Uncharacterized protein n=1 Tax=Lophiostoma macrostomum CBS 122681 TaxID=1314788 RepID=A0A6A6TQQ1_9PLEO|nr:hypothetical protein K491DRAFT_773960 [Lophiostoma macrostomum CBS 122681]
MHTLHDNPQATKSSAKPSPTTRHLPFTMRLPSTFLIVAAALLGLGQGRPKLEKRVEVNEFTAYPCYKQCWADRAQVYDIATKTPLHICGEVNRGQYPDLIRDFEYNWYKVKECIAQTCPIEQRPFLNLEIIGFFTSFCTMGPPFPGWQYGDKYSHEYPPILAI